MQTLKFVDNDQTRFLLGQKSWAEKKLSEENVTYQNGRNSHDCAYEVLNDVLDKLLYEDMELVP